MTENDLIFFKDWFSDYCASFHTADSKDQKNISLKEDHTFNVCRNIVEIAKELSLDINGAMVAETIALFHDIGRFPQYAQYRTFNDSISVNHGVLGAQTLIDEKVLKNLPVHERELIIQAVRFHNAFLIPGRLKKDIVFFIKLIRDADKLDIWRVFIEYYETPEDERASAAGLGLPDTEDYSEEVISCIKRRTMASLSSVRTLNDFKLMQLSWIYDLNFKASLRMLSERNYIGSIISSLPQSEAVKGVYSALMDFVQSRIRGV